MSVVSIDMKDILVTNSIGLFGGTSVWSIHIGLEPPEPDQVITLYDTGGNDPNPRLLIDFQTFQVRVRGLSGEYQETYVKMQDVRDVLLALPSQTINTTLYDGVWQTGDVAFIGQDESQSRPLFTANFRVIREPATGTNRVSL